MKKTIAVVMLLSPFARAGDAPAPTGVYCTTTSGPRTGSCGSSCDCYGPYTCHCSSRSGDGDGGGGRSGPPPKIFTGNKTSNYTLQPKNSSSRSRSKWSPDPAYSGLRNATHAMEAENWSAAIDGFRNVLAGDRGNVAAYKGLGWSLLRSGKPDAAILELRAARKLDAGDDQARELLADALAAHGAALFAAGRIDEAEELLREAAQLGDESARTNLQRVSDYRTDLSNRKKAEQLLAPGAGREAASAEQHAFKAVTLASLRAEEAASEEARRPFDTAGELVPPVRVAPATAIPANLAPSTPGAPPPPPPAVPHEAAAAAKPLLDRRAAAETRRVAADAQIAALRPLPASPEREAALAKAREASDRATQERVFLDLAITGTIKPAIRPAPDCRDAPARIARLSQGIASQETALARTKTILDQAASDSLAARTEMRNRMVGAVRDELKSFASDFLSSTDALRAKTRALRALGLDRDDRREVLETLGALEKEIEDARSKWDAVTDFDAIVADADAIRTKTALLLSQTSSIEQKMALLRAELEAAGILDQVGEFLASKLAGPSGALMFRATRLAIDVSALYGEAVVAADLAARAEQDYAILNREHQRVIRMRDSLERACAP